MNCASFIRHVLREESLNEIEKRIILKEYIKKENILNNIIVFIQNNHIGLAKKNIFNNLITFEYDGYTKKFLSRYIPLYREDLEIVLILSKGDIQKMKDKLLEWVTSLFNSDKVHIDENGQKTISDTVLNEELQGLTIFDDLRDDENEDNKEEAEKQKITIDDIPNLRENINELAMLIEDVKWLKSLIKEEQNNITDIIDDVEMW